MTTVIDLLGVLGRATWEPVWVPVLAWTVLALPLWLLLERTNRLHPLAEYRLSQVLLATLPIGLLATAVVDLLPGAVAAAPVRRLSVTVLPALDASAVSSQGAPTWQWTHGVGLLTIWACFAGVVSLGRLAVDAVSVMRFRRSLKASSSSPIQAKATRIARRLGTSRPLRVCLTSHAAVPVMLGGRSPTILLPATLADRPDALRMTLVHECVHAQRYDDLMHLVERIIGAVFAAHPLVNRIQRHIVDARERACDAAVLNDDRTAPADYARLLLAFAEEPRSHGLDGLTLSESASALNNRLTTMHASASRRLSSSVSLGLALVSTGLVLTLGIVGCSDSVSPSSGEDAASTHSPVASAKVDEAPSLRGGAAALTSQIRYPKPAKNADIQGRVLVQFVVDESGHPRDVQVTGSVHRMLDSAAVRAVRSVEFTPGTKDGDPVPTKMTLPISFKLPDQETAKPSSSTGEAVPTDPSTNSPNIDGGLQALREKLSYPDVVRKAGIEGTVHVTFTVNEAGTVENARVTKTVHEDLDAAALKAVRSVSFQPAMKEGEPTTTEMTVPIRFKLPEEKSSE